MTKIATKHKNIDTNTKKIDTKRKNIDTKRVCDLSKTLEIGTYNNN